MRQILKSVNLRYFGKGNEHYLIIVLKLLNCVELQKNKNKTRTERKFHKFLHKKFTVTEALNLKVHLKL